MIEPAVVALRLLQYVGAMTLMGSSLFFLYGPRCSGKRVVSGARWVRGLLAAAAVLLGVTSLLQIVLQSIVLSGSAAAGVTYESLAAVVSHMPQGKAAVFRAAAAGVAAVALLSLPGGRGQLITAAITGAVATTSLAWMGHAAATEGALGSIHRVSDVLHVIAGAVWIGALAAFLGLLLSKPETATERAGLHAALTRFGGIGSALVAVLILTGVVNSWILVGPGRVESLWTTAYGQLLSLKVMLFVAMLGLAAVNRYRLTPAYGRSLVSLSSPHSETAALRRSVALETGFGIAVLVLVAWLGTLQPPGSA